MHLIAKRGARAVSLAAVGKEAGYSRGIVNHHFGTRQALMETLAKTLQARVAPPPTDLQGLERVLALVDAWLSVLQTQGDDVRAFLTLWAEAIASDPDLRPIFAERDDHFRQSFTDSLNQGLADGTIRSDINPATTALAIVGQLRGIGLQLLLTQNETNLNELRSQIVDSLRRSLRSN